LGLINSRLAREGGLPYSAHMMDGHYSRRAKLNSRRAKLISWLLFAAAATAPLPFGSNDPPTIAFWCVFLGMCLVLVPLPSLGGGQLTLAGLAAIVIALYALVLHEQLAEHPWIALARPHPIWHEAEAALGVPLEPSVSIARNQPWFDLGRPLLCVLAITCGFLVGAEPKAARQLVLVVAWSGAAYAVYGILAHSFDPTMILWREKEAYIDSVTSTFVNRNTAAVYFGSCAIAWLLLLCQRVRLNLGRSPISRRMMLDHLLYGTTKDMILRSVMLLVCLTAMFMTRSRAGVVLSLMALIVAFTVYFHRDFSGRAGLVAAVLSAVSIGLLLVQFMGGLVNARFDELGTADAGRLATWRGTLRMIADHPWFGTGQGTFEWSFPAYRGADVSMQGIWDHAHNALLELAAEMGVPLAALVTTIWFVIFAILIRAVLLRRRNLLVPCCALSVAVLAVLHSLVDFSLQVPGFAVPALALIGAGLAQALKAGPTERKFAQPDVATKLADQPS
jgi:O-antigen ligase